MGLMDGKVVLIFGVANKNSIGWGIAQVLHEHGAQLGFSYGFDILEKRVRPLAEELGVEFVEECNIEDDEADGDLTTADARGLRAGLIESLDRQERLDLLDRRAARDQRRPRRDRHAHRAHQRRAYP